MIENTKVVYTSGTEEFEILMQSDSWTSNTEGNEESR